ncbi:MAG: hypothetical protein KAI47_21995, partial [Deltaproteobacteria bacterium]|nr:hypothetical protein [Deltaproteobacteria bacterium]
MSGAHRYLVANLHAEAILAGETLTRSVLGRISALGTLLRCFVEQSVDGGMILPTRSADLWTPLPVDPARMTSALGLARPVLVSGLPMPRSEGTLSWSRGRDRASRDVALRARVAALDPGVDPGV